MGFSEDCQALAAADGHTDTSRLHALLERAWAARMEDSPEAGTYQGWPGCDDRWTDRSEAAIDRRKAEAGSPLVVLDAIDRTALAEDDQVSYDLCRIEAERAVEAGRFPAELLAVSQMGGIHQDPANVLTVQLGGAAADASAALARLRALPTAVEQVLELLARGLSSGVTQPQIALRDVPEQVRAMTADGPANPLMAPLASQPDGVRQEATAILREAVIPAYARLARFLDEEYIPGARTTIACADLPDGADWYAHRVAASTTTTLTAQEIHDIGQAEVARIRDEMVATIARTDRAGDDFATFCEHLRTDPRFYLSTADDLLAAYRDIAKRVDPQLPKLFGTLPRLPYGVTPVPSHAERSQTTAYYMPGSPEAGRPGWFYANTYDLASRPTWEMEALTLHEAVPGHHLQIALAQEQVGLPRFRRGWGSYTAFVEGWGLYAESLGEELGFFTDPYAKFGQLTYEMWRAVRLVVDTGMHALGWSRQQAIDFFRANSSKPLHDIVVEIDRYIVWPGQALAYKLGELKLKELRARAAGRLGADFDVRAFHDRVLEAGPMPLDLLERRVDAWIEACGAAVPNGR